MTKTTRSVAKAGDVPPAPSQDAVIASEVLAQPGEVGYLIEWASLADGWIKALDGASYASLDKNR